MLVGTLPPVVQTHWANLIGRGQSMVQHCVAAIIGLLSCVCCCSNVVRLCVERTDPEGDPLGTSVWKPVPCMCGCYRAGALQSQGAPCLRACDFVVVELPPTESGGLHTGLALSEPVSGGKAQSLLVCCGDGGCTLYGLLKQGVLSCAM